MAPDVCWTPCCTVIDAKNTCSHNYPSISRGSDHKGKHSLSWLLSQWLHELHSQPVKKTDMPAITGWRPYGIEIHLVVAAFESSVLLLYKSRDTAPDFLPVIGILETADGLGALCPQSDIFIKSSIVKPASSINSLCTSTRCLNRPSFIFAIYYAGLKTAAKAVCMLVDPLLWPSVEMIRECDASLQHLDASTRSTTPYIPMCKSSFRRWL